MIDSFKKLCSQLFLQLTDSQGDSDYDFFYVTVNSKGRIQEDQGADYEDIYRVYTRYPD